MHAGGTSTLEKLTQLSLPLPAARPLAGSDSTAQALPFERQLEVLMALLSQQVEQASLCSQPKEGVSIIQPVFDKLLEAWEALRAAEAAREAEEAQLFKTKVKETTFQTEEASPTSRNLLTCARPGFMLRNKKEKVVYFWISSQQS